MDLNRETMDAIFTALNAALNKGIAQAWTEWQKWCMIVNSSSSIERYPMALITGAMREWIGGRVINSLDAKKLDVRNRDFEHTEGVNRNDIEDDSIGFYNALFESMGVNAANLWPMLATETACNPGKWADGTAFYSSTRKLGKATINNVVSGALSLSTYETGRAQMMGFRDSAGNPLALIPDTLMVGPTNESVAKSILAADLVVVDGATVSNVHKGEATLIVNPFLVGDNAGKWFLMCTNRGVRPFAVQKRKTGALQRWDKDSDNCVKEHNRNDYGIHYRGAAAGVGPHLVIGGNL